MDDPATLLARRAELVAVRHSLLTGAQAEQVTFADGRAVRYTRATLADLDAEIANIDQQLGLAPTRKRRAIGVRFG